MFCSFLVGHLQRAKKQLTKEKDHVCFFCLLNKFSKVGESELEIDGHDGQGVEKEDGGLRLGQEQILQSKGKRTTLKTRNRKRSPKNRKRNNVQQT